MISRSLLSPAISCVQRVVLAPDQPVGGHLAVGEVHVVDLAAAHRLDRPDLHPLGARRHRDHRQPVVLVAGRVGAADEQDVARGVGAGDPGLLAVDHVAAVRRAPPGRTGCPRPSRPRAPTSRSPRRCPRTIPAEDLLLELLGARTARPGRADIIVIGKKPIGICPRANSSHSRHMSTAPPPAPPYSSGIETPSQPSSAIRSYSSWLWGSRPWSVSASRCSRRPALAPGEVADRLHERALLVGQGRTASPAEYYSSPAVLIRHADPGARRRPHLGDLRAVRPRHRDLARGACRRPPSEMGRPDRSASHERYPWLVAENDGEVAGYAYAGPTASAPPTAGRPT